MRVAHIGNYKPDSANGVDKTIVGLVRHLLAQGIDIEVWHPTHRTETVRERKEDGITICDIPVSRIGKGLCFLSREAKRFASDRASSVEILHFHSVFMRENLQLSKLGIPYVVTPHGGYDRLILRGRNRLGKAIWFKLWERSYLRKARMIHAVSLPEREAIANLRLDVPVRYIPNGIDDAIFDRKAEAPSRRSDLLYLGRLALDQKGLDLLVQGYAKARAKMPEMPRLVMAGPDFRGGRAELTAMARALDIADRVDFVGPVYGEEKWRLLSQAKIFIHVSRWEGMPFALLEAMAIGRPVLITPGTNLAEDVSAAGAGVIVDGSIDAIAEGLRRVAGLSDSSLDDMGLCARQLSKTKFSWPKVVGELCSAYRAIAAH